MEAKKILEADYLDIVFESRNKAYGSYELRKNYGRRVKKAGLFALLGVASIASFSFIGTTHTTTVAPSQLPKICTLAITELPKPPQEKLYTPPPSPPQPAQPTKAFVIDKISPDDDIITTTTTIEYLIHSTPGPADGKGDSLVLGSGPSGEGIKPTIITPPPPAEPQVLVDQMPQFAGDLSVYLSNNIRYPENARSAGIQGRVIIRFVVNEDGSISGLKVVKGIGAGCDEEAIRVVSNMPKWKPGKNNGIPVKTYFTQAILFQLD